MNEINTVSSTFKQNNVLLPGSDNARTAGFITFTVGLLFLIVDNPILSLDFNELTMHKQYSFLILMLSIGLAAFSVKKSSDISNTNIASISSYFFVIQCKIYINLAIITFFLVICWWVILLGGILHSPFASLLTISPIIMFLQIFRDKKIDHDKISNILFQQSSKISSTDLRLKITKAKKLINILAFAPVVIIILTLTAGELIVNYYDIPSILLKGKLSTICNSPDFFKIYYYVYFLSVVIAAFGVIPSSSLKNASEYIFKKLSQTLNL